MSLSSVTNSQVSWQFQRGLFSLWAGLKQGRAEAHPCTGLSTTASTCRNAWMDPCRAAGPHPLGPWDSAVLELRTRGSPLSQQLPRPSSQPRATRICFVFHFHVVSFSPFLCLLSDLLLLFIFHSLLRCFCFS